MVDFLIDHLDPLGQGVSKRINLKKQPVITFIPKVLPGEQGSARIIKSSRGVEFAELISLSNISPQRKEPECPHYSRCAGCDYQHISYEDELDYKKSALLFLLRSIDMGGKFLEVIPAEKRFSYRNRVQLHYRHKYLGLVDANADMILEVPDCRLLSPKLKKSMDDLYADKSWIVEHPGRGHVELYEKEDGVSVEWNQPYANGGFSQVNTEINSKLSNWLKSRFVSENLTTILDIFSGDGNLSEALIYSEKIRRIMVDKFDGDYACKNNSLFINQDIYSDNSLEKIKNKCASDKIDLLLLDPPRKGFPTLAEWDKNFKPKYVVYVSCNPVTLSRDLHSLMNENKKLRIESIALFDMFPATKHFETLVVLKR